jgi:hypothetical protein
MGLVEELQHKFFAKWAQFEELLQHKFLQNELSRRTSKKGFAKWSTQPKLVNISFSTMGSTKETLT